MSLSISELLGYILASVPYLEWVGLSGMDDRRKYLQGSRLMFDMDVFTDLYKASSVSKEN